MVAVLVASLGSARSSGSVLGSALRAEAVKLALGVALVWLVLTNYGEAVVGALLASFVITLLIFGMAFFVREH